MGSNGCAHQLLGLSFGRLKVLQRLENRKHATSWECLCDCGKVVAIGGRELYTGRAKSCGCLAADNRRKATRTHGKGGTHVYNVWHGMIRRCENQEHKSYKGYGGRGIKVCERWHEFDHFYADMGDPGPGQSLDRYPDPNGNYESGNCRWANAQEQAKNRRTTRWLTYDGKVLCLADWAREFGVASNSLALRIKRHGFDKAVAITIEYMSAKS